MSHIICERRFDVSVISVRISTVTGKATETLDFFISMTHLLNVDGFFLWQKLYPWHFDFAGIDAAGEATILYYLSGNFWAHSCRGTWRQQSVIQEVSIVTSHRLTALRRTCISQYQDRTQSVKSSAVQTSANYISRRRNPLRPCWPHVQVAGIHRLPSGCYVIPKYLLINTTFRAANIKRSFSTPCLGTR